MKKYSILAGILCLLLFTAKSHPGGHYDNEDLQQLHHWKLTINNQPVIGNFLMSRGDMIFIEGMHGKIWQVRISELNGEDRLFAEQEISKINRLNEIYEASAGKNNQIHAKVYPYTLLTMIALLALGFSGLTYYAQKRRSSLPWRLLSASLASCCLVLFVVSCKKDDLTGGNTGDGSIPRTSAAFIDSAFDPYKPAVATSWDSNYFYVASSGIPYSQQNMMVGITSWQQQVPIPQNYTGSNSWSIPLQPAYAAVPISTKTNLMKGAVAIAANGIPIFNALNNRGEDAFAIGELDTWGGHCGKGDDYHYHAAPLHLLSTSGSHPVAFALDGFAVYGNKEPDGAAMQPLDTCHGHVYGNGVYHYHGTTTYPYVIGAMRGKVTLDPATPAPENQILPQAFAHPIRPALTPLRGAVITDFTAPSANTYNLTYRIGTKFGHVNYNWDNSGNYHFVFIDTGGVTTTANYP